MDTSVQFIGGFHRLITDRTFGQTWNCLRALLTEYLAHAVESLVKLIKIES